MSIINRVKCRRNPATMLVASENGSIWHVITTKNVTGIRKTGQMVDFNKKMHQFSCNIYRVYAKIVTEDVSSCHNFFVPKVTYKTVAEIRIMTVK